MKLNPSIKNMSNEYIFFTDQTALTFRICLVPQAVTHSLALLKMGKIIAQNMFS